MSWLQRFWAALRRWLATEPAATAWLVNGGAAALVGDVLHLGDVRTAALVTAFAAAASIYTAIRARPVAVSVLAGAATTIATAAAAFRLHLPADQIGVAVAALAPLISLAFRVNLESVYELRRAGRSTGAHPLADPTRLKRST